MIGKLIKTSLLAAGIGAAVYHFVLDDEGKEKACRVASEWGTKAGEFLSSQADRLSGIADDIQATIEKVQKENA